MLLTIIFDSYSLIIVGDSLIIVSPPLLVIWQHSCTISSDITGMFKGDTLKLKTTLCTNIYNFTRNPRWNPDPESWGARHPESTISAYLKHTPRNAHLLAPRVKPPRCQTTCSAAAVTPLQCYHCGRFLSAVSKIFWDFFSFIFLCWDETWPRQN